MYCVGVGRNVDLDELIAIAGGPENVRLLNGFNTTEFDNIATSLRSSIACIGTYNHDS